jgi:alkylation response protein AidB-like acyl-CoA dehydrogenase
MTIDAAKRLDQGDEARVEIALIKFWRARMLPNVVDQATQVHGVLGVTDDSRSGTSSLNGNRYLKHLLGFVQPIPGHANGFNI